METLENSQLSEAQQKIIQDLLDASFREPDDMMMSEIVSDIENVLTCDVDDAKSGSVEAVKSFSIPAIMELIEKKSLPTSLPWYNDLMEKIRLLNSSKP